MSVLRLGIVQLCLPWSLAQKYPCMTGGCSRVTVGGPRLLLMRGKLDTEDKKYPVRLVAFIHNSPGVNLFHDSAKPVPGLAGFT